MALPPPSFPLTVRPATSADLDTLTALMGELAHYHAALDRAFAPRDEWEQVWRDYIGGQMNQPDHLVLLAEWEGQPVGFANARVIHRPAFQETRGGHIENIMVVRTHRRKGVGRALREALLSWFGEQGLRFVEVEAAARNKGGLHFWRHIGFQPLMIQMSRWLEEAGS